jgi:hypothetical protein
MAIFCRLVKAGYGTLYHIREEMDAREVIQALNYEIFLNEYEDMFLELNK